MFVKHEHVPGEGQGHRSFFCTSGKPLSQGTDMSNMEAISETVKKLCQCYFFFKFGHR